ncbi:MAG: 1-acyl-sn-glycerol-3-phosphate acyltransferase [Chloroflexi bacterium]|nr:MAG: 1-acyl-sn-glycerol-3-phosphate acyltransferase [Chloroflexota bacterium]
MSTWFFHPGAVITGGIWWALGGGRIEGLEHVPREGAYVVVSNHTSNLDPLFVGTAVGHRTGRVIHFMAKVEMRSWPLIGFLARSAGVFFVRRGEGDRGAQRIALAHLAAGEPIAIFPEGTRSRDGQLRAAKPGVALLALQSGAPLLPVGIAGTHRIFPGRTRIPHRSPVTVRIGATFRLSDEPVRKPDRAALETGTDRIMREIAALLPEGQRGRYGA